MKKNLLLFFGLLAGSAMAQTVFINEGFNGTSIPTGWSQTTNATDGGFGFGSATSLSSQYFNITDPGSNIAGTNDDDCNCDKSADYLKAPAVDLSTQSSVFVEFDAFFYQGSYNGATESCELVARSSNGSNWTTLKTLTGAADWQTIRADASAFTGTGNSNVEFAIYYNDGGDWTYGVGIDNFKVYVPYQKDLTATGIELYEIQGLVNAPFTISGSLENVGSSTIQNFTVNYQIDGAGTVYTHNVTAANLSSFDTYNFTHGTGWTPSTGGIYEVAVWCTNLDGSNDHNPANDTVKKSIKVYDNVEDRMTLVETFTSSTCPPCVPANTTFEGLYNQSINQGRFTSLKYQMSWPGSGDPYFTTEGEARRNYYGISAVPYMLIDGGWNQNGNNITQNIMDAYNEVPSLAKINAHYVVTGHFVDIDIEVEAVEDLPGNSYTLFTAISEGKTTQNVGTNGETEFFNVMKKMLPNSNGQPMGTLMKGQKYTRAYGYKFNGNYRLPNNAGDEINHATEHSVEEFSDLKVVVWIQDNSTGIIEQSTYASLSALTVNEDELFSGVNIYPNPASNNVSIELELENDSDISIEIVNAIGQIVLSQDAGNLSSGMNTLDLNTSNLESGIHLVNIISGNNVTTKTISIVK